MSIFNNNYTSNSSQTKSDFYKNIGYSSASNSSSINQTKKTATFNNSSTSSPIFEKGSTFRGQVMDIKNNEIRIKLDNGGLVEAKLSNPSALSIGQEADFKVVYQSDNLIGLEITDNKESLLQEQTINKALEAAGLQNNEKNQAIVKELLEHNMSIDKQSLQAILRDSYKHPEANINTLVLMNKYNIPITSENIKQFEQYQNYEHRIMNEVVTLSNEIPNILLQLLENNSMEDVLSFYQKFMDLLLPTNMNSEALIEPNKIINTQQLEQNVIESENSNGLSKDMNATLLNNILEESNSFTGSSAETTNQSLQNITNLIFDSSKLANEQILPTTLSLTEIERNDLVTLLSKYGLDENLKSSILSGNASFQEITAWVDNLKNDSEFLTSFHPKEIEQELRDTLPMQKIINTMAQIGKENGLLSSSLSKPEREQILELLKNYPLTKELSDKISSGDITTKELLSFTKFHLANASDDDIQKLLNSREYQTLLKDELLSKWSLTPNTLAKEGNVEQLYDTLYKDLNEMQKLINLSSSNEDKVSNTMTSLKENIDFMKTLNELFTYVQLPIRLTNQTLHSDLYVYTNKKNLKERKDHISILLHLDMDHLGPTDIHLSLTGNTVTSKFYLSDEWSKELTLNNIERLEEALQKKGYLFQSEVLTREKNIEMVKDFLEQDSTSVSMNRYSFDIRM